MARPRLARAAAGARVRHHARGRREPGRVRVDEPGLAQRGRRRACRAQPRHRARPPAFDAALDLILEEGVDQVWARHASLGAQLRAGLNALGLNILADPKYASNTVTAVTMPEGLSSKIVLERLKRDYDIDVASGQGKITDRVIRIGHMGWCDADDIELVLDAFAELVPALT